MEISPFPYQGPLEPEAVLGRDDLIEQLVDQVTGRHVTALLGPRRYGKTSVLRCVAERCSEATAVWVDLYEVASMADVVARFDQAIAYVTNGPFARAAKAIAATLSLNLGLLSVELRSQPAAHTDPVLFFSSLLQVLIDAAEKHETLLVIDEFSFISKVPEAAGALRTALQHHYRSLGILFAGSQPSMMRLLFTSRSQPFYGQADLVEIGPLSLAALNQIVEAGFEATGRGAGHVSGQIWQFTQGHPMRSMQLADAVWSLTGPSEQATATVWSDALETVRRRENEQLERLFTEIANSDKAVLRSVANSGSVYGRDAVLLGVAGGTAAAARQRLLDSGDLLIEDGAIRLTDPMMADWIRRRFPI